MRVLLISVVALILALSSMVGPGPLHLPSGRSSLRDGGPTTDPGSSPPAVYSRLPPVTIDSGRTPETYLPRILGGPWLPGSGDISPNLSPGSRYWAGVDYAGNATNSTRIQTTIQIPDDFPATGNNTSGYVVLLSVFDNNNSYDQLGFGPDDGAWVVGSSTSVNCTNYHGANKTANLTRGAWYVFAMSISGGVVQFNVTLNGSNTPTFNNSVTTGGTAFVVQSLYECNSVDAFDFTDYEEVYEPVGGRVPYDFFIGESDANPIGLVTTWTPFATGGPEGIFVATHPGGGSCPPNCSVDIENEPYYPYFANGTDSLSVERTGSGAALVGNVSVGAFRSDAPVQTAFESLPANWSGSFVGNQTSPPYTNEFTVALPATAPVGSYVIEIEANDTHGTYSRVALAVNVTFLYEVSILGSPRSGRVDVGESVTFSARAVDGSGGYA
ncbi:MAG TPA: hypothetical protein VEH57_07810, partial [Thermoplasmata archaeon]|nr:hypothetical protein [Thermoplasmata archaeon]